MSTRTQRLLSNIGFEPQHVRACTLRRVLQSLGYSGVGASIILDRPRTRFVGPRCVYLTERTDSGRTVRMVATTAY